MMPALDLFKTRRFAPLFLTQFCGALNDNLFKTAMSILITFRIYSTDPDHAAMLAALAGGVFILPYFLFSATAGQLADGHEKSWLIRGIKIIEIFIMAMSAWALGGTSVSALMGVLFLLGTHSAFFGPLKYSILPQHLKPHELLAGNGLVEAGTFIAVLVGTAMGGFLAPHWSAVLGLVVAVLGFAVALRIPSAPAVSPGLPLSLNIFADTVDLVRHALANRVTLLTTLGISWFWALGAVLVGQLPAYGKAVLHGDPNAVVMCLFAFTTGIAVGSLVIARLLNGEISARYAPFASVGMTVFLIDLFFASRAYAPLATDMLLGPGGVLRSDGSGRILIDLFLVAFCGGAFIVPLYALLQESAPEAERSRVIAANNVVNAAFMVGFALVAALLLRFGIGAVFLIFGVMNLVVAVVVIGLLPDSVVKGTLKAVLKLCFRVKVEGLEHYTMASAKAVVVVNHVSFLDGILLAAFLPGKPCFAVNTFIARQWWVKPFLNIIDAFPVDPTNPMAAKAMVRAVEAGKKLVIFPEGRITTTGALMKVFEGPGMVADRAGADIVPVRIDGAQYSHFSRLRGKVRLRWFPKITLTVLPPKKFTLPDGLTARARRQAAGLQLTDLMASLIFETCNTSQSLFEALVDARSVHGGSHAILEDVERKPLSYRRLIAAALALGKAFEKTTRRAERVGVMLPNVTGVVATFFALQAKGRIPAMLNFSAGVANVQAALTAADIKTIITSKRFIERANLSATAEALGAQARLVYLEDVAAKLRPWDKLVALLLSPVAGWVHKRHRVKPDDAAVVLFTSGSEGVPKAVVLSHRNLLANRFQLSARVDFNASDIVFNALPVFHSFGLTGGTLLPLFSGIKTMLYPSPLHYRIVPALVYDTNATILFGTDTFLAGYGRMAHAYDFYAVRYIFAGAERVRSETRTMFSDKFGLRILEGYGATETAPVLAVNTPMHFKAGSVGRLLPGIEHRLEAVPGIEGGAGLLYVSGPNIMLGYMKVDQPGILQPLASGWYDTGDIVSVDPDGYVTIEGRAKRFAKLGGEMISLAAVEALAARLWPEFQHAALTRPDERKGEAIVLVTTHAGATSEALMSFARNGGHPELMVPRTIQHVAAIPVLATGKTDYVALAG